MTTWRRTGRIYIQLVHHFTVQKFTMYVSHCFSRVGHIRFSTIEAAEINPAAVLPTVFHHNTMVLYWSSFVPFGEKGTKKIKRHGKELFWMNALYMVSFPTSAKLPGSSWNRMDIDGKFMQGPGVKTHHSCLTASGSWGPFRKERSFLRATLLSLSPGYEKHERSLEALFPLLQLPYLHWT